MKAVLGPDMVNYVVYTVVYTSGEVYYGAKRNVVTKKYCKSNIVNKVNQSTLLNK